MKKILIAMLAIAALAICLAACKMNNSDQAENSAARSEVSVTVSKREESNNGAVNDDNGIIGDAEDRTSGDENDNPVSDIVSNTGSTIENIGKHVGSTVEDIGEGVGSIAEDIGEGVGRTAEDLTGRDNNESRAESSVPESSVPESSMEESSEA